MAGGSGTVDGQKAVTISRDGELFRVTDVATGETATGETRAAALRHLADALEERASVPAERTGAQAATEWPVFWALQGDGYRYHAFSNPRVRSSGEKHQEE